MAKRRFEWWAMAGLAVMCALMASGWAGTQASADTAAAGTAVAGTAVAGTAVASTADVSTTAASTAAENAAAVTEAKRAPIADVAALERLAEDVIEPANRLWVVTVRGESAMERYAGNDADEARRWMAAAERRLAADPDYAAPIWSVNVQGLLSGDLGDDAAVVPTLVEEKARATRLESYEQPNTFSYTYASDAFESGIRSGGAVINLMAAAHLDTESERWRVTLGTPAILIEY